LIEELHFSAVFKCFASVNLIWPLLIFSFGPTLW
jgi:hypothetical protein